MTYEETVAQLIHTNVQKWPDRVMATFESGETWTWSDAFAIGVSGAQTLRAYGLDERSHVGTLLENGPDWFRAWFSISMLGGTIVPFLPAHRGAVLTDMLMRSDCKAIITSGDLRERVASDLSELQVFTAADLNSSSSSEPWAGLPDRGGWDLHALLFTSGTTGPSKAVEVSNHFMLHVGDWWRTKSLGIELDAADSFLCDLPLAHMGGLAACVQMFRVGGRINVRTRPDLRDYWSVVRETGSTYSILLSTMADFVRSQPPSAGDRGHGLRAMLGVPLMRDVPEFMERFGVEHIVTAYATTEVGVPLARGATWVVPELSCGQMLPGVEGRIADEHDVELPPNTPGELLVRRSAPWENTVGYYGDPDATRSLMRNGWLHTGDIMSVDTEGNYFFHDRGKDYLRRRGENVSSFEVEREALAHPAIVEAACIGVQDEFGNDEIKIFLVCGPEQSVDAPGMLEFLAGRMAHFMVPRYYEFVPDLPRTDTGRVKKVDLRSMPHSDGMWDLIAAGYQMTRAGLTRPSSQLVAEASES
ncbi:AMP-binding protein [Spirillospora sp. CA-255316]